MSEILASVIIPHYRCLQSLTACVDALQKQDISSESFEVIVVQNENSTLELEDHQTRQVKIVYEPLPGSYRARNKGAQTARGDYLFFTDSDCKPAPNWISKALEHAAHGEEVMGGHIKLLFDEPNKPQSIELYERVFYFNQHISLNREFYAATANLIVKKEVFNKVGGFDASLMSGGDREWGRRAYYKGYQTSYVEDVIVFHPSRTKLAECLQRRIRIASNDLYIRMRKYGLTPEGKAELKKQLLAPPTPENWPANWDFFESLSPTQKSKVLRYHKLFAFVDYLIVNIGTLSFWALKALTKVDRLRLK